MRKLITNFRNGKVEIVNTPIPQIDNNEILIESLYSAVSYGTENYLVQFGESNFLNKVIKNKDKVNTVLKKISNEGFKTTYKSVIDKLDNPVPLGYSNLGIVREIGNKVKNFKVGDTVVSNGSHAEYNSVSENLCSIINVKENYKDFCFTVVGSIALHSVRLSNCSIGENVVVIGLGLVGLSVAQILKASGCNVTAIDIDENKEKIAKKLNINFILINNENNLNIDSFENIIDKVIITSSSNNSSALDLASNIIRKKGKIVLVGIAEIKINRDIFYKKEIEFVVSSSYGPGRYDPSYELKNLDYPISYVRWTANRNFKTVIELIKNKKLTYMPFIDYEKDIENCEKIYHELKNSKSIAAIIKYNLSNSHKYVQTDHKVILNNEFIETKIRNKNPTVSFLGSGNYASKVLVPLFKKNKCELIYAMSKNGISSNRLLKKYNFKYNTSDMNEIMQSEETDTVVISNQHNLHSKNVIQALKYNKNIFCEKPLSLNYNELIEIKKMYENSKNILMVGFNRRYSSLVEKIIDLLKNNKAKKSFSYIINAGKLDKNSWLNDKEISGGRIIGEVCHFIDLIKYITKSKILKYSISRNDNKSDNCVITLNFSCGSIASINYFVDGSNNFSKENLKIFFDNKILVLDNFKTLKGYGFKKFNKIRLWKQDKGHEKCIKQFLYFINNNILMNHSVDDYIETAKICIDLENNNVN